MDDRVTYPTHKPAKVESISIEEYVKLSEETTDDIMEHVYASMPDLCKNPKLSKQENVEAYWRVYVMLHSERRPITYGK